MRTAAQESVDGGRDPLGQLLLSLHTAGGEATRTELTARLNRGRSVISYLLGELARRQLVTVDRGGPVSGTGRPPHRVRVDPRAPVVIAAQLSAGAVSVARIGLGATVFSRTERALTTREVQPAVERLCALIAEQAREVDRLFGIGVAIPSPVRESDGYAPAALHLGWPGVPIRDLIADGLRRRGVDANGLAVDNDASLAAVAEHRHGAGGGARVLLYVTTSRVGIGGAMIVDGRLFTGSRGYGMEPGHITVDPAGAPCECGSTGCLEVETDHRGLLRAAGRDDVPVSAIGAAVDEVIAAAARPDSPERAAVARVNAQLGGGLASLVNLTDTDRVVLGGTLGRMYALEPDIVTERVAARSLLAAGDDVPIAPGELADSVLLGAGELALRPLLENPKIIDPT